MNSVRGLFLSENCYKIGPRHGIEVQWGLFYAEFCAEQNQYHYTSVPRLDQKLRHLLEIANSRIWRCFVLLLRLCEFFLPHHIMEIAIKLEPGMLERSAWSHLNCLSKSYQTHLILFLRYTALKNYDQIRLGRVLARAPRTSRSTRSCSSCPCPTRYETSVNMKMQP